MSFMRDHVLLLVCIELCSELLGQPRSPERKAVAGYCHLWTVLPADRCREQRPWSSDQRTMHRGDLHERSRFPVLLRGQKEFYTGILGLYRRCGLLQPTCCFIMLCYVMLCYVIWSFV